MDRRSIKINKLILKYKENLIINIFLNKVIQFKYIFSKNLIYYFKFIFIMIKLSFLKNLVI